MPSGYFRSEQVNNMLKGARFARKLKESTLIAGYENDPSSRLRVVRGHPILSRTTPLQEQTPRKAPSKLPTFHASSTS
jgi:hypothetical protein